MKQRLISFAAIALIVSDIEERVKEIRQKRVRNIGQSGTVSGE